MTAIAEPRPLTFPKVQAHKEKDRAPYTVTLGPKHLAVLAAVDAAGDYGTTDRELTFRLELHMAAARRCELRDVGAVRRGRSRRNGANTWKITDRGRDLLAQMRSDAA